MADEKGVNVPIRSTFDPKGTTDAAQGLHSTAAAGTEAAGAANTASEAFKGLAASLGLILGLAEIVSFFKDAAQEAYNEEKALRGVAQAAIVTGQNMEQAKQKASEFTLELAEQTGVVKDQLLEAYGKLLLATGNQDEAQARLTIASHMAATIFNGELGPAMRLVKAAAEGNEGAFKKLLGVHVEGANAAEKSAFMIAYLEKNFKDVTKATSDAAMEQDRANLRWTEFKESIGYGVQKAVMAVRDAFVFTKDAVVLLVSEIGLWGVTAAKEAGAVATFLTNVWKHPKDAWAAFKAESVSIDKEYSAAVAALEEKAVTNYVKAEGSKKTAHDLRIHSNITGDEEHAKQELKTQTITGLALVGMWNEQIKKREELLKKNLAFIKDLMQQEVDDFQKAEMKKRAIEAETEKVSLEIAKKALAAKKILAKEELKMTVDVANASVALGVAVFGQNKELAIAQAVINTYQAAAGALAAQPVGWWNIALAVLMIAEGLAQVAKIESTDAGTAGAGFDDPSNDRMAYMTGRKWAKDMTDNMSAGWSSGLAGANMGGSTTNDNSQTTNIHIGGGILDPNSREGMKQFGRKLALVMQSDSQRTIARRT
jgi:hypothetical protein